MSVLIMLMCPYHAVLITALLTETVVYWLTFHVAFLEVCDGQRWLSFNSLITWHHLAMYIAVFSLNFVAECLISHAPHVSVKPSLNGFFCPPLCIVLVDTRCSPVTLSPSSG